MLEQLEFVGDGGGLKDITTLLELIETILKLIGAGYKDVVLTPKFSKLNVDDVL